MNVNVIFFHADSNCFDSLLRHYPSVRRPAGLDGNAVSSAWYTILISCVYQEMLVVGMKYECDCHILPRRRRQQMLRFAASQSVRNPAGLKGSSVSSAW